MYKLLTLYFKTFSLLVCFACVNCQKRYDFIIVGAGAGGSVVARRLVESGRFRVLLLESGDKPKPGQDVPALALRFLPDPDVTFHFQSIPQQNAALLNNGIVPVVAGRMLGGTTSLNLMWFNRGHPRGWDNWAEVTGDMSWKYQNMLKYFKRVETYAGDFPSDQHGDNGPITVSRPKYAPGLDYWLEAGKELDYPVSDPNGPQRRSFTPIEYSKKNGHRCSAYLGYLAPVLDKPNFEIITNVTANNIIFRGTRAVGVRYVSNKSNVSSVAYAAREVIISAGSYNSPLILQRSGIGPRDVLRAANIPIKKILPTGLNLQDHPAINLNFVINNASAVMDEERDLTEENFELYNQTGDGPYSNTRGATGQCFMASSAAAAEGHSDWPDMVLAMTHGTKPFISAPPIDMAAANMKKGEVPMSSAIFMERPKSRGSVSINPKNTLGNPILDLGWLTNSTDVDMFLDAISETLRIFEQTSSYRKLQARYVPISLPACEQFPERTKEYWTCYIRETTTGGCHPAGTNKMGSINDRSAVVDSKLRVIGIRGLRVVDASIMPFIVNTNPQASVYAIAEKAAESILNSCRI